jgi:hypothetical protein
MAAQAARQGKMEKAPAFDKNNLPNMADMDWGEGIFKHYGVPGYERRARMGMGYGYGVMAIITITRCIVVQA